MNVADLAAVVSIVGAVIGTTFIVVAKLTRVEVMLTQIQSEMKRYEARIAALERWINER